MRLLLVIWSYGTQFKKIAFRKWFITVQLYHGKTSLHRCWRACFRRGACSNKADKNHQRVSNLDALCTESPFPRGRSPSDTLLKYKRKHSSIMRSTADDLKRHEPQCTELVPSPGNATLYVAQSGLLDQKQMLQREERILFGAVEKFLCFSTVFVYDYLLFWFGILSSLNIHHYFLGGAPVQQSHMINCPKNP